MSLRSLELIADLIAALYPEWRGDEDFQRELFTELMYALGLGGVIGRWGECEALEEELKKRIAKREGRVELIELIERVLKRRRRKAVKKALERTLERSLAREAAIAH